MRRNVLGLLEDVRVAATSILEYTHGLSEADYIANKAVRRAVEREFEIVGEALRRLASHHPDVSARVTTVGQIIGFRNVLAHGYDAVVDERVWNSVTADIPVLLSEVQALIAEERKRQ